jgi:hypothetical protein
MGKYDDIPEDEHKRIIDNLDKIRDLDEKNPLEQAMKFNQIKKNPPKKEYMKVELISRSKNKDGTSNEYQESPYFAIDLNTAIMANVAACPSNIIPMLIDQAQRLAVDKMKTFKPEKRGNEFNWWWIVLAIILIPGIITVILMFLKP